MRGRIVKNNMNSSRKSISGVSKDKRVFSRTADGVHHLNLRANPMRGGYRL